MARGETCTWIWLGKLSERPNWRNSGVDGRIILNGFSGSRI
jgi:hypothetical protein